MGGAAAADACPSHRASLKELSLNGYRLGTPGNSGARRLSSMSRGQLRGSDHGPVSLEDVGL
eukprot:3203769-Pyramimonas_sp.AAC.1